MILITVSSFRAKREIFLAQRSNGERQMRSSRSTHAILSLPHKYRVPQGRKRSLGYARDDDTRERAISHSLSFLHVEGCPCGAVYPPPSARPFFKGLHNSHVKTLTLRKVSSPISSFREKTKNRKSRIPYDTESRYFLLQSTNPSHQSLVTSHRSLISRDTL